MSGLYARLDKAGAWIVCGMRDCGARIAKIHERHVQGETTRHALLGPGWRWGKQDNLWRLTAHAARRVRRGQQPRDRRPLALGSRPVGSEDDPGGSQDWTNFEPIADSVLSEEVARS